MRPQKGQRSGTNSERRGARNDKELFTAASKTRLAHPRAKLQLSIGMQTGLPSVFPKRPGPRDAVRWDFCPKRTTAEELEPLSVSPVGQVGGEHFLRGKRFSPEAERLTAPLASAKMVDETRPGLMVLHAARTHRSDYKCANWVSPPVLRGLAGV